jgi:hypothetical protein
MTMDDEVIQAELAKCQDGLEDLIAKALADSEAMMRSKGATDAEIEDLLAWYSKEFDAFKQDAIAKMKAHMEGWLARDGASLN